MPKFSTAIATCLTDRVPGDPMPTLLALANLKVFASLGDWLYHDGTSDRNALGMDAVTFPRGSGLVLTIGAAVGGRLPKGAVTVTNGGTGHPINMAGTFLFWVRDANTGAQTAFGKATTDGSGVVTSATLIYGGKAGDYTNAGSVVFTEDANLWTMSHPQSWSYRSQHVVLATVAWQRAKALFQKLGVKRALTADDHCAWNGGYPGAYVVAGVGKAPPTVDTQAKSYQFWQTASDGVRGLLDQDFDNPPWTSPITHYVPNGLSGLGLTGAEPFFKVRYFYWDLDVNGNQTTTPTAAKVRYIFLDCLFEKGNYTTGSDDSSRNLISPVQEAWLNARQAEAVAAGIRRIVIFSSKDRYGQNSDGWYSFQTQWNRIVAAIQANNWPTVIITGDRHVPHAARDRVVNGDPWDGHVICPTAFGATSDQLQPYDQMDWADQSPDVPVMGSIEHDPENGWDTFCIHDAADGRVKYAVRIPWGQRTATETWQAAAVISPQAAVPAFTSKRKHVGTWANRPLAGLKLGDRALMTDVGVGGANGVGSEWAWDGSFWVPTAPVVLFRAAGNTAAPVATLTGVTAGTFITAGSIPAGMFVKPGMRLEMLANFGRPAGTPVATGGVTQNVGTQVNGSFTLNATGNQQVRMNANLHAVSATAQLAERSGNLQAQGTGIFADGALNFANAQDLTYKLASANASDTFYLLSYDVTLFP